MAPHPESIAEIIRLVQSLNPCATVAEILAALAAEKGRHGN